MHRTVHNMCFSPNKPVKVYYNNLRHTQVHSIPGILCTINHEIIFQTPWASGDTFTDNMLTLLVVLHV